MAHITEKRLYAVSSQPFVSDGTIFGRIEVANACDLFVVGQIVILKSATQASSLFKIKRMPGGDFIILGPENTPVQVHSDLSAYLVSDGATIEASEQNRPTVPEQEIERITYAEEPTIARRAVLVDSCGVMIGPDNPLPVDATISTSTADTPSMFNVLCAVQGSEYSQLLPNNTAQLLLRSRNSHAKLQLAWISGTTSTAFLTITPGTIYVLENVNLTGKAVYFNSSKENTIVEILTWS